MAATDQNYRNQYTLDIVFGVSCLAMLAAVVVMFAQDYYGPWKPEQRVFRDVESEIAMRAALAQMPNKEQFERAEAAVKTARDTRDESGIRDLQDKINAILPEKQTVEDRYQNVKAVLDSRLSFYNQAVDHRNADLAAHYDAEIKKLNSELVAAQAERDKYVGKYQTLQSELLDKERDVNKAVAELKKLNDKFDIQARLAIKKQWGWGDRFRALPILDAFASPYKIHQYTINDIPIDYNFKYVTRFDRCVTCHQGIDQPSFTKEQLAALREEAPADLKKKLDEARAMLRQRHKLLAGLPEAKTLPDPGDLDLTKIPASRLTDGRITEFAAHPRLDLFVGAKSKHPGEKFGCTSCHGGQGSATSFVLASHTPNDADMKKRWIDEHHWHYDTTHGDFLWDFPMRPHRFIESSCLKCHHQVTDLVGSDNRNEAPKVLRGYNLIKENGCFGCHDISGRKAGRQVGPDLRLEPFPPRDDLTPAELVKLDADPDKAPGNLRKVGPSLFRLSEKTNLEWTAKWIRAPREFRPETKMPHFYGLSNNHPDLVLPEQRDFPDAEINAIAAYLFRASRDYLVNVADSKKNEARDHEHREQWSAELRALQESTDKLTEEQKAEVRKLEKDLANLAEREWLRKAPAPLDFGQQVKPGQADRGRFLFTVKGCLACHSHRGVEKDFSQQKKGGGLNTETFLPGIASEAQFGPDLTQVAAKLGRTPGDKNSARIWLRQWIKDPHIHSPRSRMPVTHMNDQETADIAEWLLSQEPGPESFGPEWTKNDVNFWGKVEFQPETSTLKKIAEVYLTRFPPPKMIDKVEAGTNLAEAAKVFFDALPEEERNLLNDLTKIMADKDKKDERYQDRLTQYVGKKAIGRLGCFGCHDIPGFEKAKPIGVNLQDWGKKDGEKLAFEDIKAFVNSHYRVVDSLTDKKTGKPYAPVVEEVEIKRPDGTSKKERIAKLPYEKFYHDLLFGHQREGYLNQKILDPRSYDYQRKRTWDDLARMPEFRFARSRRHKDESDEEYEARQTKEEAEAREAVMTFILGLVADPVPVQSINRPRGDRLAEVQGRQILDKYNCAGCHVIRPGVVEFKLDDNVAARLKNSFAVNQGSWPEDHFFPGHKNWMGKLPAAPDRLTIHGLPQAQIEEAEDDAGAAVKLMKIHLTQALTFPGPNGPLTIRAGPPIRLPLSGLIYPTPKLAEDAQSFKAFLHDQGPYGGAFSDLLVDFLVRRDAPKTNKFYETDPATGVSQFGRSAAPPILIGQGERTQPNWLYAFLRDPQQIRRMTEFTFGEDKAVLRMPKFNMSPEEARALVDYFAAVERLTNPGTSPPESFETVQPEQGFDAPYWRSKTQQYVERLKRTTADGKAVSGKDGKDTLYQKRIEEFTPIWQKTAQEIKDKQQQTKKKYEEAEKRLKAATQAAEEAEKQKKATPAIKAELQEATRQESFLRDQVRNLDELVKRSTVEEQQAAWSEREAYAADAFRMVVNNTCLACHQIGNLKGTNQVQGPPLDLSAQRLRPGWTGHWLANPKRMMYYTPMPQNFARNGAPFPEFAPILQQAGKDWKVDTEQTSRQQFMAARDILMMYPRAEALPINRYWVVPIITGEKK